MTVAEPALVPIDRLGRPLHPVDDWSLAEEALDAIGLRFLMGRYLVDEGGREIVVSFPAPMELRALE